MRAVAAKAGVDPALIYHFFANKDGLLDATLSPPPGAAAVFAGLADAAGPAGTPAGIGVELVRRLILLWDHDAQVREHVLALLRTGLSHDKAARILRERQIMLASAAVGGAVAPDRRELRLALVAAQIGGLVLTRYVTRTPGVADASAEELALTVGPVIQGYLTGPLGL
jgi:AcrR family transcriptional regulator